MVVDALQALGQLSVERVDPVVDVCELLRRAAIGTVASVFVFLAPRVYAWEPTAVFHNRPKLRQWFEKEMKGESSAVTRRDGDAATASLRRAVQRSISRVEDELVRSLQMKESSGMLEEIIAETRDCTYKWIYP